MDNILYHQNLSIVLKILKKHFDLPSYHRIWKSIRSHPDFPSYLSVQYALKKEGLNSFALKTNINELRKDLPKPALVKIGFPFNQFLLIEKVDDEKVFHSVKKGCLKSESIEKFLNVWDGNAMIFDDENYTPKPLSGKEKLMFFWQKARNPLISAILLLLMFILFFYKLEYRSISNYLFLSGSLIGLGFTFLLQLQTFDKNNPILKRFCDSNSNKKLHCSGVIDSKAAKLFGMISWSDIGFMYFGILYVLNLALPGIISNTITIVFSFIAIPFIFYSLFYQKFVVQLWCKLCLGVLLSLLVLLSSSIIFYKEFDPAVFRYNTDFSAFLIISLVIITSFALVKSFLIKRLQFNNLQREFLWLKHNTEAKKVLAKTQRKIPFTADISIAIGSLEGESIITLIVSLTCLPCMNKLKQLLPIIKDKEDIRLEIIFFSKLEEEDYTEYKITIGMINNYLEKSGDFLNALTKYADNYPASLYSKIYKNSINSKAEEILIKQRNWCIKHNQFKMPTLYINQVELHNIYNVEDIEYLCN